MSDQPFDIRYPYPIDLPVIVPKTPSLTPEIPAEPTRDRSGLIALAILGIALLIPEPSPTLPSIADVKLPRRRPGNRLYYLYRSYSGDLKRVTKKFLPAYKALAEKRIGDLYAVWAPDIKTAKDMAVRGKAELYEPARFADYTDLSGPVMTCAAWQKVTDAKGDEVTRCFIYEPTCPGAGTATARPERKRKPKRKPEKEPTLKQYRYPIFETDLADYASNFRIYEDFIDDLGVWKAARVIDLRKTAQDRIDRMKEEYKDDMSKIFDTALRLEWDKNWSILKLTPDERYDLLSLQTFFNAGKKQGLFEHEKKYMDKYIDTNGQVIYVDKHRKYKDGYGISRGTNYPCYIESGERRGGLPSCSYNEIKKWTKVSSALAGLGELSGDVMECIEWKKVLSRTGKMVRRCAKFQPNLTGRCRTERAPIPWGKKRLERKPAEAEAEPTVEPVEVPEEPTKAEVKALATELRDSANESIEAAQTLYREIMDRGGIRPYRKGVEREEYMDIPLKYHRAGGLPLDEMADEIGMETNDLLYRIEQAERVLAERPRDYKGKLRKYKADDFLDKAYDMLSRAMVFVGLLGSIRRRAILGEELFPVRETLVLKAEEPGKSGDPLDRCLEKKGWNINRVRELQAKIAEKLTPSLFTGKTQKLTGGEVMLQEAIQECLDRLTGKQTKLFGIGRWGKQNGKKYGSIFSQGIRRLHAGNQP